jgi:DNA invertase Pin-like site-specific DNA recombinase
MTASFPASAPATPKRTTSGQTVGYVRVSSAGQNDARQLDGLSLDKTFTDKVSGKDTQRPQLQALLEFVREGDTVLVHSLDRLARSLKDLEDIVTSLTGRGVTVSFVSQGMAFTGQDSPMNTLMLQMLGAVAQFERSLILERQREGIAIAKTQGVYKGRKASLDAAQVAQLKGLIDGGMPKAQAAVKLGVSRATVYSYLKG